MNILQSKQKKMDSIREPMRQGIQSHAFSKSGIHPYLEAQGIIGNHGILRRHGDDVIQAKFKVGQPNDKYEQEADCIADQIMRMPEPGIQRQSTTPENTTEGEEEDFLLMFKSYTGKSPTLSPGLTTQLQAQKTGGQPLSQSSRSFFEPRFGRDFSQVRVHTGNTAAGMARELNAQAFTYGKNIFFNDGNYSPGTSSGNNLLAHELTHVIQQGGAAKTSHNVPAHSGGNIGPVQIMRRETDIIMRSPNTVMTHRVYPISERINNPTYGKILLLGGVAKMEAGKDRKCVIENLDGLQLTEKVTITSNTCKGVNVKQQSGGTFTIGTGASVGQSKFPALGNIFYDHHQMGMLDNPASLSRYRARNCQITREQKYQYNGVDISSHEIKTTFTPVATGDPKVTVEKKDINICLQCPKI